MIMIMSLSDSLNMKVCDPLVWSILHLVRFLLLIWMVFKTPQDHFLLLFSLRFVNNNIDAASCEAIILCGSGHFE